MFLVECTSLSYIFIGYTIFIKQMVIMSSMFNFLKLKQPHSPFPLLSLLNRALETPPIFLIFHTIQTFWLICMFFINYNISCDFSFVNTILNILFLYQILILLLINIEYIIYLIDNFLKIYNLSCNHSITTVTGSSYNIFFLNSSPLKGLR